MPKTSAPDQPNLLFILIDDMGWRDLTCYGSSFYETPHIDRLAAEGLRFTDAYASCPVCSPTRASVMTGRYPARVGITNYIGGNAWGKLMGVPYFDRLPRTETTIAQVLRDAGYATWHVGKWHLGPDEDHWPRSFGFDVNIAGCQLGHPPSYFSPHRIPTLKDGPEGEYLTDRLTDESIRLMREHRAARPDQPFFLHLAHYAVHTPIQAPETLVRKYEDKARRMGLDDEAAIEEGEPFPCLHKKNERVQRRRFQSHATYAAMMENLDTNVGRLMAALEELGMAENTLILFTSDNGGLSTAEGSPTCNAPLLEGKGWMYDGGNRVCCIARWPRGLRGANRTSDVPITSTDFFPTMLDAAGLPLRPELHCDGVSLMPLLRGDGELPREAIYWHYPHYSNQGGTPTCAVRAGDWKLIEFFEDQRLELYNLRQDIGESRNLAPDEPELVRDLHQKLVAWRESIEATIPEPNPDYADMLAGRKPSPNFAGVFPKVPGSDHG